MRPIDADALKELLLKERDAIPKTVTAPYYEFSVQKPNHTGDLVRGGIKKALRCMENTPTLTLDDLGIVRCKDCKYFIPAKDLTDEYYNALGADGWCYTIDKYTDNNNFCSSGDCGAKMGGGE